jgi:Zn-dependent protease with chaperone function
MNQEQFDALVARLEREAERHPALYKLKLGAFALLGYLYVLAMLLGLAVLSGALVASLFVSRGLVLLVKKLIIPIVVLIGLVVKSMWVKLEPPQGFALKRREHPALFAAIDDVRRAAKAPRAHTVLLTNELNAAIVQIARLGLFGWQKNYLILGLPLMQLLSPEEFKAVLAHEFGHLSAAHGRFGAWIYRARASWARLNAALQQDRHWGSFLFVPFFGWFAPKFAAYSFVQARHQEYEADRLAAETVGASSLANALVRLDIKAGDLAQDYWPSIYAHADEAPTPDESPFAGLLAAERRAFMPAASQRLQDALERKTDTADTHPCLKERIAALATTAALPRPFDESAAEALLGAALPKLIEHFDDEWRTAVSSWWRDRHEHVRTGRQRLESYRLRPLVELDDDAFFDYAQLIEELDKETDPLPLYQALAAREGRHAGARFACGRLLLERGDESGIARLEELMAEDGTAIRAACDHIVGFLRRHGRDEEAQPYVDRYWARWELDEAAQRERDAIRLTDTWLSPTLPDESCTQLKRLLGAERGVKAAYLVRKKLADGDIPLHVVGIVRRRRLFESSKAGVELMQRLAHAATTRDELFFIPLDGDNASFGKRFKKVAGSRIYP